MSYLNATPIDCGAPCNNHCRDCRKPLETNLSLKKVEEKLDQAIAAGNSRVFFAHRELLARPDLSKILAALGRRSLGFGLASNGRALAVSDNAGKLKRLGLEFIELRLQAGRPYPYFLATGQDGFHQVLEGMRLAMEAGIEVRVVLPVDRYSRGSLKSAMIALASQLSPPEFRFDPEPGQDYAKEIEEAISYFESLLKKKDFAEAAKLQVIKHGEDVEGSESESNLAGLRQAMSELEPGRRLRLQGRLPIEPAFISDLASVHGLRIVDYRLPGPSLSRDASKVFKLTFQRDSAKHDSRRDAIAVFSISSACVANCRMCTMSKIYAERSISTEASLSTLEELKLSGFDTVDLFGGEITLREDLLPLIRRAKELNLYIMLITTGYNIDSAYLAQLIDAGLDKITVALDAPDAPLHDHIKGRKGLFDHAVRALEACRADRRIYTEVNTVLLEENMRDLERLHRMLVENYGVQCHRIFYYTHAPTSLAEPQWLSKNAAREFFEERRPGLLQTSRKLGSSIDFCPPIEAVTGPESEKFYSDISQGIYHTPRLCGAPHSEISITPEGEIYPCVSPTVSHRRRPLGVIGQTRIIEAIHSEAMQEWKVEAGTWPECSNCISRRDAGR